ncbi:MAG: type IV pilus assembly protein PilM, partial [Actinomycetota bacterium]
HLSFSKHPPVLLNFGQVSLPAGCVREGEIIDVGLVSQAITELWKRAQFKGKRVSLGVANQKVVARSIDLPFMEEKELRGAIQFQVQEFIPIAVEDAVLDFQILDEYATDNGERMMRVLLVAAQKEMIRTYVEAVEGAGLTLDAIDFIPLALIRALGDADDSLASPPGVGEALIDVGAGITSIVVHDSGAPRFARVLSIGGNSLTESIATGMAMTFEEAESLKQTLGVTASPGQDAATGEGAGKILEQRAAAFLDEVRGSLDYYLAQAEATKITKVIVAGGGAKLNNLRERLGAALRLPVEVGRPLQKVQVGNIGLSSDQLAEAEPLMGAPIGIALGARDQ